MQSEAIPAPIQSTEQLQPAEYPLGGPLSQNQLIGLRDFSVINHRSFWQDAPDTKEEYAVHLQELGDDYSPALGFNVLRALGPNLRGVQNEVEPLQRIAQTEQEFQTVLVGSVLHGYNSAVDIPQAYLAIAGSEAHRAALDAIAVKTPQTILTNLNSIKPVLEPAVLSEMVQTAYEAIHTAENLSLKAHMLSDDLAAAVGSDKLVADSRRSIEAGTFFNSYFSGSEYKTAVELGVITTQDAVDIALNRLRADGNLSAYQFEEIAELGENPDALRAVYKQEVLSVVGNPDIPKSVVSDHVHSFTNSYKSTFDKEYAQQLIGKAREVHGDTVLASSFKQINTSFGEDLAQDILKGAVTESATQTDMKVKGELSSTLLGLTDFLDETTTKQLLSQYAEADPGNFVSDYRFKPTEKKSAEMQEYVCQRIIEALPNVEPNILTTYFREIKQNFPEGDVRFKEHVLPLLNNVTSLHQLDVDAALEVIGVDGVRELFITAMSNSTGENSYYVNTNFNKAVKTFGVEDAKALYAEQATTRPEVANNLVRENHMLFNNAELKQLMDVIMTDESRVPTLIYSLSHLAPRLPKEEVLRVLDKSAAIAPEQLFDQLHIVETVAGHAETTRLVKEIMQKNPAVVLTKYSNIPEGIFSDVSEVIDFMEADERTEFAPKYFKKTLRRLAKSDQSTSFIVMSQEAVRVYMKINRITREEGGVDMVQRIQETMGKMDERAELDSLSLAALMAIEKVPTADVNTATDAKVQTLAYLNRTFGQSIAETPLKVEEIEQQIGSLVPLAMYSLFTNVENKEYLKQVVSAVNTGTFKEWRYGDLESLTQDGALPKLDQKQYEIWQQTSKTETADIVAGDAASVAHKIKEVIGRGLFENPTIQKLANLDNPLAMSDNIKEELGQIGRSIAEVHRRKGAGELTAEEAAVSVSELEVQKAGLELATNTIRLSKVTPEEVAAGVLFNDKGRPTKVSIDTAIKQIVDEYGANALDAFAQLQEMLDDYRDAASTDIGNIVVTDTDDFQTSIEIGVNPIGSCQHYELGSQREGLLGYFEPSTKIIAVRNDRGKLVARAVTRLASDAQGAAVMVIEPTYMSQASNDIERSIINHAKMKAATMGVEAFVKGKDGRDDVVIRGQRAPSLYSDVFGGLRNTTMSGGVPTKSTTTLVPA